MFESWLEESLGDPGALLHLATDTLIAERRAGCRRLQIAETTRHLGGLSSWVLDRQTSPYLESMAWTRFLDVLDAALLQVDQASYQARAEQAARQRDVRSYRDQRGLRVLVARAEAGDVAAFEALVARAAACLAEEGGEDPVGVRRSKALGIIAPTAAGKPDNPTPASTCGDHPTTGSPSSPTKAPSCSATNPSPTPSGRPPNRPSLPLRVEGAPLT